MAWQHHHLPGSGTQRPHRSIHQRSGTVSGRAHSEARSPFRIGREGCRATRPEGAMERASLHRRHIGRTARLATMADKGQSTIMIVRCVSNQARWPEPDAASLMRAKRMAPYAEKVAKAAMTGSSRVASNSGTKRTVNHTCAAAPSASHAWECTMTRRERSTGPPAPAFSFIQGPSGWFGLMMTCRTKSPTATPANVEIRLCTTRFDRPT